MFIFFIFYNQCTKCFYIYYKYLIFQNLLKDSKDLKYGFLIIEFVFLFFNRSKKNIENEILLRYNYRDFHQRMLYKTGVFLKLRIFTVHICILKYF